MTTKTLQKKAALLAHTHCPKCGEHFAAVGELIDKGKDGKTQRQNWVCSRCEASKARTNENLVVTRCPNCMPGSMDCQTCKGLGSVRIPMGSIPVYRPE